MGWLDILTPITQTVGQAAGAVASVASNTANQLMGAASSGISGASGAAGSLVSSVSQGASNYVSPVITSVKNINPLAQFSESGAGVNASILSSAPTTSGGQPYLAQQPIQAVVAPSIVQQPQFNPVQSALGFVGGIPQAVTSFGQGALNTISSVPQTIVQQAPQAIPMAMAVAPVQTLVGLGALGLLQSSNPSQFKPSDISPKTGGPDYSGAISTVPRSSLPSGVADNLPYNKYNDLAVSAAEKRAGYTNAAQLGDSRTQAVLKGAAMLRSAGFNVATPDAIVGRTLEAQRQASYDSGDVRSSRYYGGELQKWAQNKAETASAYHSLGTNAGVPIPANKYEYQGDLAVEFLKGAPTKSSEWFSPASGEMSKYLPGGKTGLQQYMWNDALATDRGTQRPEGTSFSPAVEALIGAEGKYGPYAGLYGAPPSSPSQSISVRSLDAGSSGEGVLTGRNKVAAGGETITATTPENVEMLIAGGALPKPYVSGRTTNVEASNPSGASDWLGNLYNVGGAVPLFGPVIRGAAGALGVVSAVQKTYDKSVSPEVASQTFVQRSDIPAVALEGALAAGDKLLVLPSSLVGQKWTPGSDLLARYGQTGTVASKDFAKQMAVVEAQKPQIDALGSRIEQQGSTIDKFLSGKLDQEGKFVGSEADFATYQNMLSQQKSDVSQYNEYNKKTQDVLASGYRSGAIIPTNDGGYQLAPSAARPYGAFSDWNLGAQKLTTGIMADISRGNVSGILAGTSSERGITPEKFAAYERSSEFQNTGTFVPKDVVNVLGGGTPMGSLLNETINTPQFYEGALKVATNPEELMSSGLQGVQLYALTGGLGKLAPAVPAAGATGVKASVARILNSPLLGPAVGGLFLGQAVDSAAGGFNIGEGGTLVPKVGEAQYRSNLGGLSVNLAAMGAGAAIPGVASGIRIGRPPSQSGDALGASEISTGHYESMNPSIRGLSGQLRDKQITLEQFNRYSDIISRRYGGVEPSSPINPPTSGGGVRAIPLLESGAGRAVSVPGLSFGGDLGKVSTGKIGGQQPAAQLSTGIGVPATDIISQFYGKSKLLTPEEIVKPTKVVATPEQVITAPTRTAIRFEDMTPAEIQVWKRTGEVPTRAGGQTQMLRLNNPNIKLYRGESTPAPEKIPSWLEDSPDYKIQKEASGRWFTPDIKMASDYAFGDFGPDVGGRITSVEVPRQQFESFRVSNLPEGSAAKLYSNLPTKEFYLPSDVASNRKVLLNENPLDVNRKPQSYGSGWENYLGNVLPSAGKIGSGEIVMATGGRGAIPKMGAGTVTPEFATQFIANRYPEHAGMSGYGTETQVIFPGMKGGEHLKPNEAQLTEAEMNLWKNKALYNFAPEQSAIFTPRGKVLDYGSFGKITSTESASDEFVMNNKNLTRVVKNSVMAHSHPSYVDVASAGEGGDYRYVPKSALRERDPTMGRSPSDADILSIGRANPLQGVIINRFGATVMELPTEIRVAKRDLYDRDISDNIYDLFRKHEKTTNKIANSKESPITALSIRGYRKLPLEEKKNRANYFGKQYMAQFAHFAADTGMKVRFVNDINPETGIGTVSGFPQEILDIASKRKPVSGLYSPVTGEKIYSGNEIVVRGTNAPEPRLGLAEDMVPHQLSLEPTSEPGVFAGVGTSRGLRAIETYKPSDYLKEGNGGYQYSQKGHEALAAKWDARNMGVKQIPYPKDVVTLKEPIRMTEGEAKTYIGERFPQRSVADYMEPRNMLKIKRIGLQQSPPINPLTEVIASVGETAFGKGTGSFDPGRYTKPEAPMGASRGRRSQFEKQAAKSELQATRRSQLPSGIRTDWATIQGRAYDATKPLNEFVFPDAISIPEKPRNVNAVKKWDAVDKAKENPKSKDIWGAESTAKRLGIEEPKPSRKEVWARRKQESDVADAMEKERAWIMARSGMNVGRSTAIGREGTPPLQALYGGSAGGGGGGGRGSGGSSGQSAVSTFGFGSGVSSPALDLAPINYKERLFGRRSKLAISEEQEYYREVPGMTRPASPQKQADVVMQEPKQKTSARQSTGSALRVGQEIRADTLIRPRTMTILGTSVGQGIRSKTKQDTSSLQTSDVAQRSDIARITDALKDVGKVSVSDRIGKMDMKRVSQKSILGLDNMNILDTIQESVIKTKRLQRQETKAIQDIIQLPKVEPAQKVTPKEKPDEKITPKDKVPPPPIPIIPKIPGGGFGTGGGGGHAMVGGGKRFREVFQYSFDWTANTNRKAKNINTGGKQSNIGINIPSIGLNTPSKPIKSSLGLDTPTIGKGLLAPKKTVIESTNPSRSVKSSVPKSMKAPVSSIKSSGGLGISSLDIGRSLPQKKKGKK